MRGRSAVKTMLQERADDDRNIENFPCVFRKDASPYLQNSFSPLVRSVCSSARRPLMSGLRIAKVIFLGDVSVGKTCLVNRFCSRVFNANYKATIGVDFEVERFDILKVPYNLQIWDTAGQERFKCIASSYYRAANAIVLVFDLTSPTSLLHCTQWLHEALAVNTRGKRPYIFLVGTKRDLLCDEACAVAEDRAAHVARQLVAELWTLSSRTGDNVKEFFFRVAALTFDFAVLREIESHENSTKIGTDLVISVKCTGVRGLAGYATPRRTTKLKDLLHSTKLEFLMEAHSGLSARIVEEAGFRGVWASGLSIAAQLGVRDSNEASWTQVLAVAEYMADATSLPILLDADTGYGNFNNARRLVRKLEERGIAGCCIEDKLFPKTNSLLDGRAQPLADIKEFALKIQACKDYQNDPDFCVVARMEAFIAGWGLEETIKRADVALAAGADAILVHSKRSDSEDIEAFMRYWGTKSPVIIVPTKYYATPTDRFRQIGVSTVIWANHNLRSSIRAMQDTSAAIFTQESISQVEKEVVPVNEVFRLQKDDELREAEEHYLPRST